MGQDHDRSIPRVIYQTFKTAELPDGLKIAQRSWQEENPDFRYEFFDDDRMHAYVAEHFGPREVNALRTASTGAFKADLWRYLVIGREGGIYADIDSVCEAPITWLDDDKLVVALNGPPRFDVSQWTFAAPPGHPVVLRAAQQAVDNILRGRRVSAGLLLKTRGLRRAPGPTGLDPELRFDCPPVDPNGPDTEFLTGPPVFQAALETVALHQANATSPLADDRSRVKDVLSSLVALRPPYFGGAVRPKYFDLEVDYRAELQRAGVKHWSSSQSGP